MDEGGFEIGESEDGVSVIAPKGARNNSCNEHSESVTGLELISATGRSAKPLLIYKGAIIMDSWFPEDTTRARQPNLKHSFNWGF